MYDKLSERFMFYSGLLASMAVTVGADVRPEDLKHISDLLEAEEQGLLLRLPHSLEDRYYVISEYDGADAIAKIKVQGESNE